MDLHIASTQAEPDNFWRNLMWLARRIERLEEQVRRLEAFPPTHVLSPPNAAILWEHGASLYLEDTEDGYGHGI